MLPACSQPVRGLSHQCVTRVGHHRHYSSCTQRVEHIQRDRPCAGYFVPVPIFGPLRTPKGSYLPLSSHLIDEADEARRREVNLVKFPWLARFLSLLLVLWVGRCLAIRGEVWEVSEELSLELWGDQEKLCQPWREEMQAGCFLPLRNAGRGHREGSEILLSGHLLRVRCQL